MAEFFQHQSQSILADFTIAPIVEISSGSPFNILTGVDANGDLQSSNDRPSVAAAGRYLYRRQHLPPEVSVGTCGITHGYASLDFRVMRDFRLSETLDST